MQFFGHCPLQKKMDADVGQSSEKIQHEAHCTIATGVMSNSQDSVIEIPSSLSNSPATSSMDTFDSNIMTPASSNLSQSTQNTPDMLLRTEPWSPGQMEPPLPNMFSFENTGFTPLPQDGASPPKSMFSPTSPSKEPHASQTFWMPEIATDNMTANMGMYSELFSNNAYAQWSGNNS